MTRLLPSASAPAQECAEHDGLEVAQHAGLAQLFEHAIDAVAALADVFEEQDAGRAALQRRAQGTLQHGEVAARSGD